MTLAAGLIRLNLRAGDRVRVGDVLLTFQGKAEGVATFEVQAPSGLKTHLMVAHERAALPGQATFLVEKRSGKSARIALSAPASLAIQRLPA